MVYTVPMRTMTVQQRHTLGTVDASVQCIYAFGIHATMVQHKSLHEFAKALAAARFEEYALQMMIACENKCGGNGHIKAFTSSETPSDANRLVPDR